MGPGTIVFDSHALLTFLQKEKGHEKIVQVLRDAAKSRVSTFINVINLGEIVYVTKRAFGDQKKIEVLANLERLGVAVLPVPNELVFKAAEYKAQFSISYADCFVLASAIEHNAAIVTGDPEFKKVEHLASVIWI